jgi:hypothetical protein
MAALDGAKRVIRNSWWSLVLGCSVLLAPMSARAQDDCYKRVLEFATEICGKLSVAGSSSETGYGGKAEAMVNGMVSRLVDLGASVNAERSTEDYENLAREQLPLALEQGRQCRSKMAMAFYDKMCGTHSAALAPSAKVAQFNLPATIDRYPPAANVFSGPGTNYPVIVQVFTGIQLMTHTQSGDFWLVRLPRGRVGYMHTSRIKLLPQ